MTTPSRHVSTSEPCQLDPNRALRRLRPISSKVLAVCNASPKIAAPYSTLSIPAVTCSLSLAYQWSSLRYTSAPWGYGRRSCCRRSLRVLIALNIASLLVGEVSFFSSSLVLSISFSSTCMSSRRESLTSSAGASEFVVLLQFRSTISRTHKRVYDAVIDQDLGIGWDILNCVYCQTVQLRIVLNVSVGCARVVESRCPQEHSLCIFIHLKTVRVKSSLRCFGFSFLEWAVEI